MKLVTYSTGSGAPKVGYIEDGGIQPLGDGSLLEYIVHGRSPDRRPGGETVALEEASLHPPIARPEKIVAIGLNYEDHAAETGAEIPDKPVVFTKYPNTIIGPGAPIRIPPITEQVDYEAELAVVIGRRARRVEEDDALGYVLGYTCLNDVSARDLQFGDGQWARCKSLDTFCPMGPVLVTRDEIPDPQDLDIECRLDDRQVQQANTAQMYFGVAAIVSYCSQAFSLEPGDVIATGTPGGVGIFRKPPLLLTDGDLVSVEIERIGRLVNRCRHEHAKVAV